MPGQTTNHSRRTTVEKPTDVAVERAYEKVVADLTSCADGSPMGDVAGIFREVLDYNVPHGKRNRLMALVHACRLLSDDDDEVPDLLDLACIAGWCIELLQAYFLVLDDIMDKSVTRRGRPCWYTVDGVGLRAINDAVFLHSALFQVLRRNLRHVPAYHDIVELFLSTNYRTIQGQCLDMLSNPEGKEPNLTDFTEERYAAIVMHKTSFYSFVLPIRAGMYLAGIADPARHAEAEKVALKIGQAFQVQDDFLDCYGNPEQTGKIGTDIVDGKCSWLAVRALRTMTSAQREKFQVHFGRGEPGGADEAAVKGIYVELNLRKAYDAYIADTFAEIDGMLGRLEGHPRMAAVFHEVMRTLLNRSK